MKDVFISFSSKQTEEAERICNMLESHGLSCFISTRDLTPGEEYAAQLVQNLDQVSVVVLLLSAASNDSPHVLREVEYAVSHHIPILVYKLEEVTLSKSMEYFLMTHQWITDGAQKDDMLVNGIRHLLASKDGKAYPGHSGQPSTVETPKTNSVMKSNPFRKHYPIIMILLLSVVVLLLLVIIFHKPGSDSKNTLPTTAGTSQEASSEVLTEASDETAVISPAYAVGDTVSFGTYLGTPIEWRILRIEDQDTLLLVSKYILSFKSYDAAEGGTYNEYEGVDYWSYENHIIDDDSLNVLVRGNNDWSISNLRTWLNSDKEVVNYPDQAPTRQAVGHNFYNDEPGFLFHFSETERQALLENDISSPANSLSNNASDGKVMTKDKVFLLSVDELQWFEEAGIPFYAEPTQQCIEQNQEAEYYQSYTATYQTKDYYWWLRDAKKGDISSVSIAGTPVEEENCSDARVGVAVYGVRPAIRIQAEALAASQN